MKKILITGGAGFIGSNLVDRLIKEKYKVIVIDNLSTGKKENLNKKAKFYQIDICSSKISEVFKKEKPEIVYHFAAQMNIRKSVEDPLFDSRINILGSLNILQNSIKFKIKKFIFASSGGAIYGNAKKIPISENYNTLPISPYGIAKLTVENYLKFYKENYNLNFVSLRFANVYGPRQNPKGEAGIVSIFIDNFLKNKNSIIFGNGKQTRDFIFVEDVVDACFKILNYSGKENIFNIGTGVETSVNELYYIIIKILKSKIKPKYVAPKKGELMRNCLDISKIKKELNWKPKIFLKEGLIKTIDFFN